MKKITLLVGLLVGFTVQSQTTIFEQTPVNASGSISGYANLGTPVGIYSADDFELTAQTDIYSVTVYGVQGDDNAETLLTGFSLYIYNDTGGIPSGNPSVSGSGLLEIVNLSPTSSAFTIDHSSTSLYNFTVDIATSEGAPLTLQAGTYWIVAAPHGNFNAITDPLSKLWLWFFSNDINLSDAQFIDPDNFYGNGTAWNPVSTVTGNSSDKALAFTIMGDDQAAIVENSSLAQVSLYPNPVMDEIRINLPDSIELESATVYSLLGQPTNMKLKKNNVLDLSKLASGVYILELKTNQGTLTKKVIKK